MSHLRDVNMSYFEHLVFAWKTAGALIIHGICPGVLVTYASDRLCHRDEEKSNDDYSPYNTVNS